eukprot:2603118-Lingulodinium_polyedra.AAC.1
MAHSKAFEPAQFPSLSSVATSSSRVPSEAIKAAIRARPPTPPVPCAFLEGSGGEGRAHTPASSGGSRGRGGAYGQPPLR